MRNLIKGMIAVAAVATVSVGAVQPAQARDNGGVAIAAGIIGLGVGAAIASDNEGYSRVGYYDRGYYPAPRGYYYGANYGYARPYYRGGYGYGYGYDDRGRHWRGGDRDHRRWDRDRRRDDRRDWRGRR